LPEPVIPLPKGPTNVAGLNALRLLEFHRLNAPVFRALVCYLYGFFVRSPSVWEQLKPWEKFDRFLGFLLMPIVAAFPRKAKIAELAAQEENLETAGFPRLKNGLSLQIQHHLEHAVGVTADPRDLMGDRLQGLERTFEDFALYVMLDAFGKLAPSEGLSPPREDAAQCAAGNGWHLAKTEITFVSEGLKRLTHL
jgi:hypothetical protein